MWNWTAPTVLADEGSILIELDIHTVTVFSQGVITTQFTFTTKRRLAVRVFLISIAVKTNKM